MKWGLIRKTEAMKLLERVCFHFPGSVTFPVLAGLVMALTFLFQWIYARPGVSTRLQCPEWAVTGHAVTIFLMIAAVVLFAGHQAVPFIYFQF
jgi:hypothetical protein